MLCFLYTQSQLTLFMYLQSSNPAHTHNHSHCSHSPIQLFFCLTPFSFTSEAKERYKGTSAFIITALNNFPSSIVTNLQVDGFKKYQKKKKPLGYYQQLTIHDITIMLLKTNGIKWIKFSQKHLLLFLQQFTMQRNSVRQDLFFHCLVSSYSVSLVPRQNIKLLSIHYIQNIQDDIVKQKITCSKDQQVILRSYFQLRLLMNIF